MLTGVSEPILDYLPTGRPRHAARACLMLRTASTDGVSTFFTLTEIGGGVLARFVPLALFWAFYGLPGDVHGARKSEVASIRMSFCVHLSSTASILAGVVSLSHDCRPVCTGEASPDDPRMCHVARGVSA